MLDSRILGLTLAAMAKDSVMTLLMDASTAASEALEDARKMEARAMEALRQARQTRASAEVAYQKAVAGLHAFATDDRVEIKGPTERARLDLDGTAEPKTRLVAKSNPEHCIGPGTSPVGGVFHEDESGQRTEIKAPR